MEFGYLSDYGLYLFIKYKYAQLQNIFTFASIFYLL